MSILALYGSRWVRQLRLFFRLLLEPRPLADLQLAEVLSREHLGPQRSLSDGGAQGRPDTTAPPAPPLPLRVGCCPRARTAPETAKTLMSARTPPCPPRCCSAPTPCRHSDLTSSTRINSNSSSSRPSPRGCCCHCCARPSTGGPERLPLMTFWLYNSSLRPTKRRVYLRAHSTKKVNLERMRTSTLRSNSSRGWAVWLVSLLC